MSTFEVTVGDLESLASQLSSLLGEIGHATSSVTAGASGAAENGRLQGAIDSFLSDWSQDLRGMQEKLSELSARLHGAAGSYSDTESNIVSGFSAS
ncbi:MAG TPA: type VII secretion target [Solirubrobacteraceae bacterium]|nr:type VII secretion target [Solirubrobacteraceae bacterium]